MFYLLLSDFWQKMPLFFYLVSKIPSKSSILCILGRLHSHFYPLDVVGDNWSHCVCTLINDEGPIQGQIGIPPPPTSQYHPSKHGAFTQCCFNVGPASKTQGQHWNSIDWMPGVCSPCRFWFPVKRGSWLVQTVIWRLTLEHCHYPEMVPTSPVIQLSDGGGAIFR